MIFYILKIFLILFSFFITIPHQLQAEPSQHPITFTIQPGLLHTQNFRDLQDGWHPLIKAELHAKRRTWLGYTLTFGLSNAEGVPTSNKKTRYLTTGLSFFRQFEKTRLEYRLQYGSLFTTTRASMVFLHGINGYLKMKSPWQLQISLEHILPNDWLFGTDLKERYGSFILSIGGGFSF